MATADTTTTNPSATQDVAEPSPTELALSASHNLGNTIRASWRFSSDNARQHLAHFTPEAKELLLWAFNWCIDPAHPMAFADFCDRIGYNTNTVYKIYSGKYLHPTTKKPMDAPPKLVSALRQFKRLEVTRSKLGRKKFVPTPTAQRIFQACDLARESQTPVFVEGASQIGKTEAFSQYCLDNNHGKTRLIQLEAVSGLHGLVKAVAQVLGISPNGNAADLTERIKRAITPDMVLIFDEVHLLANTYRRGSFFACMEWIRRLYDFCQFGLVLSFTTLGFTAAEKERKRELEQIFRRGVHRLNLGDRPHKKDIAAILAAWGLEMPALADTEEIAVGRGKVIVEEPFKLLEQLAGEQGLKAIIERLRYAAKFAADDEADLAWQHVCKAHLVIQKNAQSPDTGWGKEAA
jgi:DNA transposition AAA+ family ATPase